jgi:diguanylate cyclase (GGDEF)-like protein/PAS domain S-box-containing protein
MEDAYIQTGVLGGYVTSGGDQGRAAAEMALRHLSSTPVADIRPLEESPNRYIIDGAELRRAGLVLPGGIADGASIINQPATFYQRHIDLIVWIFYALLALFILSLSASLYLVSRKGRQLARTTADLEAQARVMAETQESLTRAQRIAHMGNWDWRVKDGTYYWSDGMYRLVAAAPGDGMPSHDKFLACVHPADRRQVADAIQSSLFSGVPYNRTHRLVRRSGEVRIVQEIGEVVLDADGAPERMISTVLDITEQALTEQALRDSEEKLRTVIEAFPVILWVIDRDGIFTLARGAGLKLLGEDADRMVGQSLFDMYREYPDILQDARRALAGESLASTHWLNETAFDVRYSPLRGPDGEVIGAIGVAADVTESKHSEQRLSWLANFDPVTGLPNRNLFSDRLDHAIQNAQRGASNVALLFLDLDNFKNVNDTLGHLAGDELLQQVSQRLLSVIRASDTASRLGGDEFTIILENLERAESAALVAQKIIDQSGRPFQISGREIFISSSIGIALFPGDGESAEALLMSADAAMYRAKSAGRNNFQFSSKEANAGVRNRLELGTQLQRALERGEFSLNYQPQVDARDGRVVGFEALLRWQSQDRGAVPPGLFIPILEETGLIVPVGEWVLGEACRWASQLPDNGDDTPLISVNLSPRQFLHPDLYRMVENALIATQLSVHRLELEITESSLIDPHMNIATMERLKRLGVHLTIDDFGTGYSSLSYLKRFPVDRLKIDASFVRDVAVDADDAAIVTAIIGLSDSLRLRAVAEGVETAAQLQFLQSRGCHEIQGYYIARPMPGDAAKAWLENWYNGGRGALLPVIGIGR